MSGVEALSADEERQMRESVAAWANELDEHEVPALATARLLATLDRDRITEERLADVLIADGVIVYTTQSHDRAVTLLSRATARNILAALTATPVTPEGGEL